jgi:hypothetical protein
MELAQVRCLNPHPIPSQKLTKAGSSPLTIPSAIPAEQKSYGDTFCVVTPSIIYLRTSNAELGSQVTTRRNDFLKPVARYKIVDIFGRSILTQEGLEWKRHKRVVGPSFSEKSNRLVFEESLRESNTNQEMRIERLAVDTATLSFHVICAAGFGGTYCLNLLHCFCTLYTA